MPTPPSALRFAGILLAAVLAGCAGPGGPPEPRFAARPAAARDAYVVFSGGGTPLSNNYSQYLQAQALAGALQRRAPPEQTWVFFGIGNRPENAPELADVRRDLTREAAVLPAWVPGPLPRNRPATKAEFLRALREEILPTVREGGTLYLFVGDHGELIGRGEQRESAITMWQLERGRRGGWTTDRNGVLGVAELRRTLAEGIGRGRVVFCMTQCHSGGFHELAVPREPVAPAAWFTEVPEWAAGRGPGLRLRAAGFTATDEASMAAGCDPDPDPDHWVGYERFLPEALLGRDLMTGARLGLPAATLAEAHAAAVRIDQTIDKPRSTSEHYLESWARLIENRLVRTLTLTESTRRAVAAYQQAVDSGRLAVTEPALRARQAQFAGFLTVLGEQVPSARTVLTTGTRRELEAARRPPRGESRPGGRRGAVGEARRAWSEVLRPAWKRAVEAGQVELPAAVREFERHLLKLEDEGRNLLLGRGDGLLNEMYWKSGYATPATLAPARAEAVTRWGVERRGQIVDWGLRSADDAVMVAARTIGPGPTLEAEPDRRMSRQTAAERVLYYRRVLAAWEFLVAMEAQPALGLLHELIALEETPVPWAAP
ncbi:MAG: hypothetical protein HZC55_06845 [Verrucomicrobia bacterium]|nr:hypothetical protein [Verrucomicrobiota bacterium]